MEVFDAKHVNVVHQLTVQIDSCSACNFSRNPFYITRIPNLIEVVNKIGLLELGVTHDAHANLVRYVVIEYMAAFIIAIGPDTAVTQGVILFIDSIAVGNGKGVILCAIQCLSPSYIIALVAIQSVAELTASNLFVCDLCPLLIAPCIIDI